MRHVASVRQLEQQPAWSYWSSALASMTSGLEDARPAWLRVTINDLNLDPGPKQQVFNEYVKVSSTETVLAILHRLFAEASTRASEGRVVVLEGLVNRFARGSIASHGSSMRGPREDHTLCDFVSRLASVHD